MCLGIPGQILERVESSGGLDFATVDFGGLTRRVCVSCVPEALPGDHVIVHAGIAISRINAEEAERIKETLLKMEELEDQAQSEVEHRHEVP